jgi:hypothetical protein
MVSAGRSRDAAAHLESKESEMAVNSSTYKRTVLPLRAVRHVR